MWAALQLHAIVKNSHTGAFASASPAYTFVSASALQALYKSLWSSILEVSKFVESSRMDDVEPAGFMTIVVEPQRRSSRAGYFRGRPRRGIQSPIPFT